MLYLYYYQYRHGGRYLSARIIASAARVNYYSLLVLLARWCSWRYITRIKLKGCYGYRLSNRGEHFIRYRVPADIREELTDRLISPAR
jgi:hypothetical protein